MSEITATQSVSAQTLEHVLGTGDLAKLSTEQRVEYYAKTCQSLGLNPLTRPFRFLTFNGQIQLYATKDGTDQLRSLRGITLHIVDKQMDAGLYIVTARARTKDGREDEDIGAVTLPRDGESRANALMKGTTKAKRRVTLSICGLGGMPDESELDGMPGAMTFDPEDDPPVAKVRTGATQRDAINKEVPLHEAPGLDLTPLEELAPDKWMQNLELLLLATAQNREEVEEIARHKSVKFVTTNAPDVVKRQVSGLLAKGWGRFVEPKVEPPDDMAGDLPDVKIEGEDKILAG